MEWATAAALALQYGVPFVEFLVKKIEAKGPVTSAEWAEAKALASVSSQDVMIERLRAAGIDPDSDQGKKFLSLVQ